MDFRPGELRALGSRHLFQAGRDVNPVSFFEPSTFDRRSRPCRDFQPFHETFLPALSYFSPNAGLPPARRHPVMSYLNRGFFDVEHQAMRCIKVALLTAATLLLIPTGARAQASNAQTSPAQSTVSAKQDRWLHVRVISSDARGETVRVNVPLELAEKVLPAVNHDRLHNGKVRIDPSEMNDVDLRALMEAIRTAKEGQYVTVEGDDNDVRVAKEGNHLTIHVRDKSASKKSQVEVKVPIKVIDALLSAGKDE